MVSIRFLANHYRAMTFASTRKSSALYARLSTICAMTNELTTRKSWR